MIAPQQRDEGGLGWLFQLVAVFVFFVLPVLRSISETRKKAREGPGRAPKPRPKPAERPGKDLWRELLEGRVEPPAASPTRPVAAPSPRPEAAAPRPGAPRPAPLEVPAPRPAAALESVPTSLLPRIEDTYLEASFRPSTSELATREIDPATLDDEMLGRWDVDVAPAARPAPSPVQAALLGGGDWRRAVLLAEVLAPPLTLRGPAAAWPGPPASLRA